MQTGATERAEPRIWFRAILGVLAAVQLVNGLWAVLAPRSFYEDFPFGRGWVEAIPPYNEHLMGDVGGLFVATAVLLGAAAWWLERRLVAVAIVAWLAFAVPHAIYHLFIGGAPDATGDAIANAVAVIAIVGLPGALLVPLARRPARVARAAAPAPSNANGRVAGVPEGSRNPFVRWAYRSSRKQAGAVLDPIKVFAHHPRLLAGYGALELAAERSHRAPERLKHLGELRAGMLAGCEWCLDFGSAISADAGVSEDDLRALPSYRSSDRFGEVERLVLDYATGISRTPVDVPDALFERLRERFDEAQLVELTALIALENFRARFNWAFGIDAQGFSEGSYCLRPEATPA